MNARPKNPGRIEVESWEAGAMREGTMVQKRVPGPAYFWKAGQLRWVQEPFTEYVGVRKKTAYGIVYHADHEGATVAGYPAHLKHVQCRVLIRQAHQMRRESSRMTIEVTEVSTQLLRAFDLTDATAEGCDTALRWGLGTVPLDVIGDSWSRRHGLASWRANPQIVLVRFRVINAPIARAMAQREAA